MDYTKPCWYWDKEDLARTPSQLEGLDPATEVQYRQEGARFIFDLGTRLGLHYTTVATGIVYFHRFYMFHSFKQFPRYVTGVCGLFLAGKVEETPKRCDDILRTAYSLLNSVQLSQFGDDPKEEVLTLESILLQTIKFDLQVEHPYKFLLQYAKQLKGDKMKLQKLVQMAWTFINDSLCTTLSLQWEPEIIAVSVMYLAGRLCKFEIQEWTSKPTDQRWWEQFVQDVPEDVLKDICHQILDFYSTEHQKKPHPAPQLQQPLQSTPQGPSGLPSPQSQSSEQLQTQQKEPRKTTKQQRQHAEWSEKPYLQPSPHRQVKSSLFVSSKEYNKAAEPQSLKIPQIQTTHPPRPPPPPLPSSPPPLPSSPPPLPPSPPPLPPSPPPLPPLPPPLPLSPPPLPPSPPPLPPSSAPPPSFYISRMSNTNSYMLGMGDQSMQYIMNTEGSVHRGLPPECGQPTHLPYYPHIYPLNPSPYVPLPPHPPASFLSPEISRPSPVRYSHLTITNLNFPPSQLPPIQVVPPYPYPGQGMAPARYPPPAVFPYK
ncbi:cyclin-K-like [Macrotis lagotis]|uniref:cyclin-K-like n=1 Tax=Macrotis lagotis TaxID=92651 RepID=UPI003D6983FF